MEGGRGELSCFVAPAREGWDGVGKERGSKKDYYGRENETLGASSPSPSSPFFLRFVFGRPFLSRSSRHYEGGCMEQV